MTLAAVIGRQSVTLRQLQAAPFEVWHVSCCCGHFDVDAGDKLLALELWNEHANTAGHDGDFALLVVS